MDTAVVLDCDRGREMGCQSFCCKLIVRLKDGERDPTAPDNAAKRCVDKDPVSGRCIHQHPDTGRCAIWAKRPSICREYDCNDDEKLQVVLQRGFTSLMRLAGTRPDPGVPGRRVPYKAVTGERPE